MSGWTLAWLGWIAYFAAIEGYALYLNTTRGEGEARSKRTLSSHGWAWFGTAPGTRATWWAWVRRGVLVVALVWLAGHFLGGGTWWWFEA